MDIISLALGLLNSPTTCSLTLNSSARGLSLNPGPPLKPLVDKPLLSSPPSLPTDTTFGEDKWGDKASFYPLLSLVSHPCVGWWTENPSLGKMTEAASSESRGKADVVPLRNISKGEELGRICTGREETACGPKKQIWCLYKVPVSPKMSSVAVNTYEQDAVASSHSELI